MKDLASSPKIKTGLIVHTIDVKLTKPRVRVLALSFQATYLNKLIMANCQATGTGTWDLGPGTWE